MNRRYAHLPRTALALLAAAGTIWLAAFFLPGAVVEPIPLLPSIGGAAGKVVEAAAPSPRKHATVRHPNAILAVVRTPRVPSGVVPPRATSFTPVRRAVQRPQHAHPRHHAPRPKHSTPVQKAAPAQAPASTNAGPVFYGNVPSGRAVGWHRKHDQATAPVVVTSVRPHGNGHAKHDVPVQPAPTPAAPVAAPPAGTDSHDNGKHLGDQHDHGDQGQGPGGKK